MEVDSTPNAGDISVKQFKLNPLQQFMACCVTLMSIVALCLSIIVAATYDDGTTDYVATSNLDSSVASSLNGNTDFVDMKSDVADVKSDTADLKTSSADQETRLGTLETTSTGLQTNIDSVNSDLQASKATFVSQDKITSMSGMTFSTIDHGSDGNSFWDVVRQAYMDAAMDAGVGLDIKNSDGDQDQMNQYMSEVGWGLSNGGIVSIVSSNVQSGINEMLEDSVPVVSINSGSDVFEGYGVSVHIGQDETDAGTRMAQLIIDDLAGDTTFKALCINMEPENAGTAARCNAFKAAMEANDPPHECEIWGIVTWDYDDPAEIQKLKDGVKTRVADGVHGIFTMNNDVAKHTWEAVEEAGETGNVDIGTFDWSADVIDAIEAGKCAFAIDQQQYLQGYIPVILLKLKYLYDVMPSPPAPILTGPHFIKNDASELAKYRNRNYFDKSTTLQSPSDIRIAVVVHGHKDNSFWMRVMNAVRQAGRDFGVRIDYRHPAATADVDMAEMATIINYYVTLDTNEIDGLVVSIPSCDMTTTGASELKTAVQSALSAGIKVISINSGDQCYGDYHVGGGINPISAHVGQKESDSGTAVGDWIVSSSNTKFGPIGAGKKVLCVNMEAGNDALQQRCDGIKAKVEAAGYDFHMVITPNIETTTQNVLDAVNDYKGTGTPMAGTDLIVACGPVAAVPSLAASNSKGTDGPYVGTFDLEFGVLESLATSQKGVFVVDQQQWLQGYLPIMFHYLNSYWGNIITTQFIHTGPAVISDAATAQKVLALVEAVIR